MAEQLIHMFCNFYFVENQKIANKSTTAQAREKVSTDLQYLEVWKFFMYV